MLARCGLFEHWRVAKPQPEFFDRIGSLGLRTVYRLLNGICIDVGDRARQADGRMYPELDLLTAAKRAGRDRLAIRRGHLGMWVATSTAC